jgi:hypothetical protein
LHDHKSTPHPAQTNEWSIGRCRYFWYVFSGAFCWYWFPRWIMHCLSFQLCDLDRSKQCCCEPNFWGQLCIGLIPVIFDWTAVSGYIGSPLIYSFHAIDNTFIGLGIMVVSVIGITYSGAYSGAWRSAYLAMFDSTSFDNTGNSYNTSRILTENDEHDLQNYLAYSPMFV